MSSRLIILLCTLVVAADLVQAQLGEVCHTQILNSRKELDLNRYAGIWYRLEYAIFNRTVEESAIKCATMYYDVDPADPTKLSALALYQYIETERWEADRGNITVNANAPGIWKAEWESQSAPVESVILSTDYDNWAYNYACQIEGGRSTETLTIWSRARTLNPTVRGVIRNLMNGLGFSSSLNVIIDHEGCQ